jgi:hypothetical protein
MSAFSVLNKIRRCIDAENALKLQTVHTPVAESTPTQFHREPASPPNVVPSAHSGPKQTFTYNNNVQLTTEADAPAPVNVVEVKTLVHIDTVQNIEFSSALDDNTTEASRNGQMASKIKNVATEQQRVPQGTIQNVDTGPHKDLFNETANDVSTTSVTTSLKTPNSQAKQQRVPKNDVPSRVVPGLFAAAAVSAAAVVVYVSR